MRTLRFYAAPLAVASALIAGLSACALPQSIPAGTSTDAVVAQLGPPVAAYPLGDGASQRLIYPGGGLQQETWVVDFDAKGRSLPPRQVLQADHFATIRTGVDTREDVARNFGPPRLIQTYRSGLTAWLYPYKEKGVWNSEMAVYFDDKGRVQRVENGPDPRFLGFGNDRD